MTEGIMPPEIKLFDENQFFLEIEALMAGGGNYIDGCCEYCSRRQLEVEVIANLILKSAALRSKLLRNAEELNYIKKTIRIQI